MTILEEIQNEAVDKNSDLGTILRKCKVLAARLRSEPLENWLIWESNGYPDNVKVPEYRIWPLEVKGHFYGPFGSGWENAPIPHALLPEKCRESYERYESRISISGVEEALKEVGAGSVRVSTGDLALILGTKVYKNQNCVQAWAQFSTSNLIELLNAVRNRILDFSLALWKESPNAGDKKSTSESLLKPSRVTQIFNTKIYGGSANLVGTMEDSSAIYTIVPHDFRTLETFLRDNGLDENDIGDLHEALKSDESPVEKDKFGPKVSTWIAKMVQKAADGGWSVGIGAAGTLLAQAVAKYYGL
ncbi:hypothetical protein KQH27_00610 [bacterium]|nr:hypothetical protein [bacterium]